MINTRFLQDIPFHEINTTYLEKLEKVYRKHLRRSTNTTYPRLIYNCKLYKLAKVKPLIYYKTKQRWKFFGKLLALKNDNQINNIMINYFSTKPNKKNRSITRDNNQ